MQNSHDSGGYRSVVGRESIIRDIKACQTAGNAHGSSLLILIESISRSIGWKFILAHQMPAKIWIKRPGLSNSIGTACEYMYIYISDDDGCDAHVFAI